MAGYLAQLCYLLLSHYTATSPLLSEPDQSGYIPVHSTNHRRALGHLMCSDWSIRWLNVQGVMSVFRGVMLGFRRVMLGFRRVIFGSEVLYSVQWGYVVSIQHVDHLPAEQGRR